MSHLEAQYRLLAVLYHMKTAVRSLTQQQNTLEKMVLDSIILELGEICLVLFYLKKKSITTTTTTAVHRRRREC